MRKCQALNIVVLFYVGSKPSSYYNMMRRYFNLLFIDYIIYVGNCMVERCKVTNIYEVFTIT